ncbi:NADPH-dependent 2,4-dienoyl-CoA reductase/sulfur reductase-like enzyme [Curtobacterium luteum]|uniref:NADPH-dependent 2,4-dienoyl-CoA reductase/sulfur reductase-like enzyme n=1 Tax=Curtobacterium luteum TaxID=33881 RepID=A0A8H9GAM6_9MICO|nr:FAD-dependent oxidoreductase [Curtobacterium luteum]MBM7803705.1 NADPH-dependent 2,4-dienoyl-CoA reductase/sulfur reductase-like enzyme [Curtobacterium luteum]NUU51570.1 FAD-dependent oxidoreductase [Curtobacterium luteum]GGL03107.1 pyridine nucleotide-disulfide oxidoreductase [Curtobacterium luteum]
MTDFRYLIVGGGMVADSAARGIRELDADGTIGIVSEDVDPPYARPALSKKLWTDPEFSWDEKVDLHTEETGATFLLGSRVTAIDRDAKTVTTDSGETHGYERLLIATGGKPRGLPGLEPSDRVLDYRSAADYRKLREFADAGAHVVVVGGGYIGTEITAGISQNGAEVTFVDPDDVVGGRMFPDDLARAFQQRFVDAGVDLRLGRRVSSGEETGDGVVLTLDDGSTVEADAVVVGLGIEPVTQLAADAGLTVRDGIVVSSTLRTDDESVFAAGDVAEYPDRILGTRRVEHVDNAQQQGRQAGRNLADADETYDHTPMFYSDVFDMGYEAVGQVSSSLHTVEDWTEPTVTGVVYYLDDDQVVKGVLLWNVWDKTDEARKVLADAHSLTPDMLIGRIQP